MTIRTRILTSLLAISMISILLLSYISIQSASNALAKEVENSLNVIADKNVQKISAYILSKERQASALAQLDVIREALKILPKSFLKGVNSLEYIIDEKQVRRSLRSFKESYDNYNVILIAVNGDVVFSTTQEDDFATNLLTGPFKKNQLADTYRMSIAELSTQISSFVPYVVSGKQQQYSAFIGVPVFENNKLLGVVVIQLNAKDYFELTTDYIGLGKTGQITLAKKENDEILVIAPMRYRRDAAFNLRIKVKPRSNLPIKKALEGHVGSGISLSLHQKEVLAAWRYIPELKWGLVVSIEVSEAFASSQQLKYLLMKIGFGILLVVILIGVYLSKIISAPIKLLTLASKEMSAGDLTTRVNINSKDEIGRLSHAFNKMASDLEVSLDQAQEAVRLKSEFLANMSHEIRTPMNGVMGMLELLLHTTLTDAQRHKVELAQSSATSLLKIINDILDFSKVEAGKLDLEIIDFSLRQMLDEFVKLMAYSAQKKGIEIILDTSQIEYSMVQGDPGRLRQILTNLIGNAIKFTKQGEILICASLTKLDEHELEFKCSIVDTGIGIPEEKLDQMFDSFRQADTSTTREYGGAGLGLSIAKQLCLLMDGDIVATSHLSQGSRFEFKVKLKPSSLSSQVLPNVSIQDVNILIVDDNETNREVLRGQLEHWGAKVTEADSGFSAIELCNEHILQKEIPFFDVALIDMQMPGMDGAELGKRIKVDPRFSQLKLVMMTSMLDRGDIHYFANLGFNAYFTKPTITSDLFDALAVVVDDGEVLARAKPLVTHDYLQTLEHPPKANAQEYSCPWPSTLRVLLVEDDLINQEVAQEILNEFNLKCEIASNGLDAINMLKSSLDSKSYDLILMDCQMSEMDGFEATKQIREGFAGEENKGIIIIAMTANAMKGDREHCIASGMDDYISKPVEIMALHEKLEQWLKH